jgi:hypothetical protein
LKFFDLDTVFHESDRDIKGQTLRKYMKDLVWAVIEEEDGFSGKRPFGNSGWIIGLMIDILANGDEEQINYYRDVAPFKSRVKDLIATL